MAKINQTEKHGSSILNNLRNDSFMFGETNDCAVMAVAITCKLAYEQAHALLKNNGRKNRKGVYNGNILAAISDAGFIAVKVNPREFIDQYPAGHRTALKNITTHHPARFNAVWKNGKTYLAFINRHVLAIVNGQNHDWTEGSAHRIYAIYEITKK